MTHLLKCRSSVDAPTWFKPLSDLIILTLPLRPTNLLKLIMNESVLREYTTSICMTLLERQVHRAQYLLTSFWPSPTRNDTNKSNPRYVNGGSSLILSLGKSATFCCWSLPVNCLHQTLQDGTSDQKVKSCHQRTLFGSLQCLNQHELLAHDTNSAILQDFGSNIGCCISFARAELWIFLKLLIFLHHQCMDLPSRCCYMASSVFLFAKKLILLQHVFSGQIWLSSSLPSLFLPSPIVYYKAALCDPIL